MRVVHRVAEPAFGDIERRGPAAGYGAPVRYTGLRLATHRIAESVACMRPWSLIQRAELLD
jgi:hypothetical protein